MGIRINSTQSLTTSDPTHSPGFFQLIDMYEQLAHVLGLGGGWGKVHREEDTEVLSSRGCSMTCLEPFKIFSHQTEAQTCSLDLNKMRTSYLLSFHFHYILHGLKEPHMGFFCCPPKTIIWTLRNSGLRITNSIHPDFYTVEKFLNFLSFFW